MTKKYEVWKRTLGRGEYYEVLCRTFDNLEDAKKYRDWGEEGSPKQDRWTIVYDDGTLTKKGKV